MHRYYTSVLGLHMKVFFAMQCDRDIYSGRYSREEGGNFKKEKKREEL